MFHPVKPNFPSLLAIFIRVRRADENELNMLMVDGRLKQAA